ncbi:MAG TPA: hypothetical protein VHM25_26665 [Polyangiaceae bacterium]|jgi:hypothetical protein|nr:hypothetical protein [Polyangiaceae bacterium]
MKISTILVRVSIACLPFSTGCNPSEPTTAVLSNEYPAQKSDASSADSMPVYKGWWSVAQFPEAVPAGLVSDPVRIVEGSDYGYALLAPGWDMTTGVPPTTLIPLRSAQKLSVGRGELLTFAVSEGATVGDCQASRPLSQDDADFITQRIFPGEFAGLTYDAASCTSSPVSIAEGGAGGESGDP